MLFAGPGAHPGVYFKLLAHELLAIAPLHEPPPTEKRGLVVVLHNIIPVVGDFAKPGPSILFHSVNERVGVLL